MKGLISRLKEPSSYAALTGLLAMIGINIDPGLWQDISVVLAGIAGIVGFFMSEKGPA